MLETGAKNVPSRAVDDDRDASDVGLRGDEVEELHHRLLRVEHPLVEVDVDHLCAAVDLLPGHRQRALEIAAEDELREARRARDVGALADVDEVRLGTDHERLEPAEARIAGQLRDLAGLEAPHGVRDGLRVHRRGSTATTHEVHPAVRCELVEQACGDLRSLVETAECVRQPGVRVAAQRQGRQPRELLHVRAHLLGAQRAVDADGEHREVLDGDPEGLERLSRERPAALIDDCEGDHRGHTPPALFEVAVDRMQRRLGVERVEDRLDQEQVHAPIEEASDLIVVGRLQLVEGDAAGTGIVDVTRDRSGAVGRPERARDPHDPPVLPGHRTIGGTARRLRRHDVHFESDVREPVVELGDRCRAERVGLHDVRAGREVLGVNLLDQIGMGDREDVAVALQVPIVMPETISPEVLLTQLLLLDAGAHRAVDDDDALLQQARQLAAPTLGWGDLADFSGLSH